MTDDRQYSSGRRWARLPLALVAALAMAGGSTSVASGATYDVESCWGAGNAATNGWVPQTIGNFVYIGQECGSGGTFQAFFKDDVPHADGDIARFTFAAPLNTSIAAISAQRSAQAGPYQNFGNPVGMLQADGAILDRCQQYFACSSLAEAPIQINVNNARELVFGAFCSGPAGCPAGATSYRLRQVRVTLNDDSDPVISTQPTGSLTSGQNLDRNRTLVYSASDQGGGVYRQRLSVDGIVVRNDVVNANNGKCAAPFRDPVPCRTSPASGSVDLDTSTLADGVHTLRLEVRDATDVNHTETAPWTITVDNVAPVVGPVSVAGAARAGDRLTCSASATGQSPAVSYGWLRANPDGSGQTVITGAQEASYTLSDADVGKKVICRVAATDHGGTTTGDSPVTSGPFADGATVTAYCTARPTGATDECGDNDGDHLSNREDPDDDNDGVADASDPAPFDAALPGKPAPGQPGQNGDNGAPGSNGSNGGNGSTSTDSRTSTTNTTNTTTNTGTELVVSDLNTILALRNPISEAVGNGQPPAGDALLAVKLVVGTGTSARSTTRAVAAYRQKLRVRGTLQTPAGRAVAAARVYLVQKALGGPETSWRLDKATVTAADGSFTLPIAAGGRSRDIRVVYFPHGGSNLNRGSNALTLKVRQDATFQVSRRLLHNGGKLTFSGRVLGAVPTSGVDVRVQVRLNRSWFTFTKLTTTRAKGGRFQSAHRFTKTTSPTTYRFRILVLPRNRTVYTNGFSRHIDVRVLP